ncbi:Uncharacterised protein [Metamycoplasma alkalescens]|uniref:Uncharacterized protein n=1 Tax=Metamycoplasma alkalescens TaxID=45363 RepID=A0A3B0PJN2_9BACT|nr:Uncharacterised protein [Metamycoplasma alkalescens]
MKIEVAKGTIIAIKINGFFVPNHPAFDTKVYCNEIKVISGITINDNKIAKKTFFPIQFFIERAYPNVIAKNNLTITEIVANPAVNKSDCK